MVKINRLSLRESASRESFAYGSADVATRRVCLLALAAAALALLLTSMTAATRETKLGSIGFELPKDWKVQMDGTERLTASPSGTPNAPPLVMAEFCVSNSGQAMSTRRGSERRKDRMRRSADEHQAMVSRSRRKALDMSASRVLRRRVSTLPWAISSLPPGRFAWCTSLRIRISRRTSFSMIWPRRSERTDVTARSLRSSATRHCRPTPPAPQGQKKRARGLGVGYF